MSNSPSLVASLLAVLVVPAIGCGSSSLDDSASDTTHVNFERDGNRLRAEFVELPFTDGTDTVWLRGRVEVADGGDHLVGRMVVRTAGLDNARGMEIPLDAFKQWQAGYASVESARLAQGDPAVLPAELGACSASTRGVIEVRMSRAPVVDGAELVTDLVAPEMADLLFGGRVSGAPLSAVDTGGYGTTNVADATFARFTARLLCGARTFRSDVAGFVSASDGVDTDEEWTCRPGHGPC